MTTRHFGDGPDGDDPLRPSIEERWRQEEQAAEMMADMNAKLEEVITMAGGVKVAEIQDESVWEFAPKMARCTCPTGFVTASCPLHGEAEVQTPELGGEG